MDSRLNRLAREQELQRLFAACQILARDLRTKFLFEQFQENDVYYALIGMSNLRRVDFWMMKQLSRYDREQGRKPEPDSV